MDEKELAARILYALQFQSTYLYAPDCIDSLIGPSKSPKDLEQIRGYVGREIADDMSLDVTVDGEINLLKLARKVLKS